MSPNEPIRAVNEAGYGAKGHALPREAVTAGIFVLQAAALMGLISSRGTLVSWLSSCPSGR